MHYYVNKLHQNVGLETWKWRQIVTSQTAHQIQMTTIWPWTKNSPWKYSAYTTDCTVFGANVAVKDTSAGGKMWDGARGKKQVWRPHVRTRGLLEANVEESTLWHFWDFSAPSFSPCHKSLHPSLQVSNPWKSGIREVKSKTRKIMSFLQVSI